MKVSGKAKPRTAERKNRKTKKESTFLKCLCGWSTVQFHHIYNANLNTKGC